MKRSCPWLPLFLSLAVTGLLSPARSCAQTPKLTPTLIPASDDDADSHDNGPASYLSLTANIQSNGQANIDVFFYFHDGSRVPPALIKPALQSAFQCVLKDAPKRAAPYFYSGSCQLPLSTRHLLREGHITTSAFTGFAAQHRISSLSITLELPDHDIVQTLPPGAQVAPQAAALIPSKVLYKLRTHFAFVGSAQTLPSEITFRFGYSTASLHRAVAILLVVLFVPIVLFVWLSRKALSANVSDKAVVWFSYMRSLSWVLNGTLVAWWIALESIRAESLLAFLAASTPFAKLAAHPALFQAFVWIPPVLVWLVCFRISHPVQQKLRGLQWTKRELTLQALYSAVAKLFPFAMFLTGLRVIVTDGVQIALLWWFGAFLLRVVGARALLKNTGMLPQALSSGDLRDRAFSMAERMRVNLQHVYLLSSGKGQLANAFARSSNTICFTDFLLNRLSQREVDYVLGHELTHLKLRHPVKLGQAYIAAILLSVCVMINAPYSNTPPAFHYALVFLILALLPYIFSRRFEYSADAGAVAATGDPRGAISALFKLSELNMMPIHWSHWREKWLTHPSSMRRARAIAQKAGIPFDQISLIAREGTVESHGYAIPAAATPATRIHSTLRTTSINLKLSLALIAVLAFVPSLLCLAAIHLPIPARWTLLTSAIPVTLLSLLALVNYSPRIARDDVRALLSQKLAGERIQAESWNAIFVGLSPAALPRIYDGTASWDIGFLFLESDRLCYCGEETRFALTPAQITAIRMADGLPSLINSKRIYVAWNDDQRGTCGVFHIARGQCKSLLAANRETQALFHRLQTWRQAPPDNPLPPPLSALSSPTLGAVTSQSPAERWNHKRLTAELIWTAIFAGVGATLCGLPINLLSFLTEAPVALLIRDTATSAPVPTLGIGCYAVAVALVTRFIMMIPHFRYRDVPRLVADAPTPRATPPVPATPLSHTSPVGER